MTDKIEVGCEVRDAGEAVEEGKRRSNSYFSFKVLVTGVSEMKLKNIKDNHCGFLLVWSYHVM